MHGIDIQGAVVILDEAHNIVSFNVRLTSSPNALDLDYIILGAGGYDIQYKQGWNILENTLYVYYSCMLLTMTFCTVLSCSADVQPPPLSPQLPLHRRKYVKILPPLT